MCPLLQVDMPCTKGSMPILPQAALPPRLDLLPVMPASAQGRRCTSRMISARITSKMCFAAKPVHPPANIGVWGMLARFWWRA